MAEQIVRRGELASSQDDVIGLALNLTLQQSQSSSADVPHFLASTVQTDDPSQTAVATGSTDPPQRDNALPTRSTRFTRHSFKLELFYRDVGDLDERFDRRGRKRQDLLSNDEEACSSIYRARHAQREVDPASDHEFLVLGEDENELRRERKQCASSAVHFNGRDWSSENRRIAELKEIEWHLLVTSDGKLNPKMLDVRPSSSMIQNDRERWDKIAAQLVQEMSDTSMTLGHLVNRIRTIHAGKDGEDRLISEFGDFANIIAARVAEVCEGSEQTSSGLFKSSATHEVGGEKASRHSDKQKQSDSKLDVSIHGEHAEHVDDARWDLSLSFGALILEPWKDLGDTLLGQMLRQSRKLLQNHPVSGRSVAFSLCGYLFRLMETNPAGFSTSACYDFRNPKDHIKIVTMIAYLAGTPFKVSQQWEPSPNQTITIRREGHQDVQYLLSVIERLAVSPTIWGRRTAVWSAQAVPLDGAENVVESKGLPMIIKSAWLPKRCYSHELDICEVIDKARRVCLASDPASYIPNLPIPVGQVIDRIGDSEVSLDNWETPDGSWQLSTLATFCEVGKHVDEAPITVANHIQLHTSLIRALLWLVEAGIHYRDLNNGNVLRSKNGDVVLIDFGNSRYLKRPRGQKGDSGALELSLDDAHSGTLMFMSRRIHALTNEAQVYRSKKAELEAQSAALLAAEPTKFTGMRKELLKAEEEALEKMGQQLAERAHQHCYIDDAEAQVLLMNRQMLYTTGQHDLFRDMEDLALKQTAWDNPPSFRDVIEANEEWVLFAAPMISWRKSVQRCHEALATGSAVPDDGYLTPHERQSFNELVDIMATMGDDYGRQ